MEALAMGNYGVYVWSCFGLTFTVLAICIFQARSRHRKVLREIRTRMNMMESES